MRKAKIPSKVCVSCIDLKVGALGVEGHVKKQHIEYTIPYEMNLISKELQLVCIKNEKAIQHLVLQAQWVFVLGAEWIFTDHICNSKLSSKIVKIAINSG